MKGQWNSNRSSEKEGRLEFDPDKQIPKKIIRKLLKNAHIAPSAGKTQVQEFVIVTDPTTKKKSKTGSR